MSNEVLSLLYRSVVMLLTVADQGKAVKAFGVDQKNRRWTETQRGDGLTGQNTITAGILEV